MEGASGVARPAAGICDTPLKLDPQDPVSRTVYLVNSTPKYYYMLPLHFALLRRYGGLKMRMDIVLATEVPEHPIVQQVARDYEVEILPLKVEDAGFLDSRAAALRALLEAAPLRGWEFVLPMQEDFLLDRYPTLLDLREGYGAYGWLGRGAGSVRLMPCPGPQRKQSEAAAYWELDPAADAYGFTFQATLWRLDAAADWYSHLCAELERAWPRATTPAAKRIEMEVRANFAENADGQRLFWAWSARRGFKHMAWVRAGPWSNAVYLSPWPYRPTAIVKGRLEAWAEELGRREGLPLAAPA
jgi:hypothetical protein